MEWISDFTVTNGSLEVQYSAEFLKSFLDYLYTKETIFEDFMRRSHIHKALKLTRYISALLP